MKSYEDTQITRVLDVLAADIYSWAEAKGFWNRSEEFPSGLMKASKIALMHSELSELLEGLRKNLPGMLIPDSVETLTNEEEEIADLIIRALDYSGKYKLRIGAAVAAKMAKNEGRPYMHGKKF